MKAQWTICMSNDAVHCTDSQKENSLKEGIVRDFISFDLEKALQMIFREWHASIKRSRENYAQTVLPVST